MPPSTAIAHAGFRWQYKKEEHKPNRPREGSQEHPEGDRESGGARAGRMTSTRALTRALGLSNLSPAYVVKQVTGTNALAYQDYLSFWSSIQRTQSSATKMMIELLSKYVEVEKHHAKRLRANAKEAVKEQNHVERMLWMLVNTIRFIDLFLGVESNNPNLRKAHRAYETHRNEFPAVTPSQREMDAFLKTVFRSSFDAADTTNALVMELVFVNSVEWTLESTAGSLDLSFSVLRDSPFIGLRLLSRISSGGKGAYVVFNEMIKQLKSMPSLIRAQPALMNSTLGNVLALLFIIEESFSTFAVIDRDLLKRGLEAVRQFENWPIPYGPYASKLVSLIQKEIVSPGSALRRRIQAENPLLTSLGSTITEKLGSQSTDWAAAHRTVTILYNPAIPRSYLLRRLVARSIYKGKAWTSELNVSREEILINLLETHLVSTSDNWHQTCIAAIKNRPAADLNTWFDQAMRCLDTDGHLTDPEGFLVLARNISRSLTADSQLRFDHRTGLTNDPEEVDILADLEVGQKDPFKAELWTQVVPRIPYLSFEFLEIFTASSRRAMTQEGGLLRGGPLDDDEDYSLFNKGRPTGGQPGKSRRAKTRASLAIPGLDMFSSGLMFEDEGDLFGSTGQHGCPQNYLAYPSDFEELLKDARAMLPPDDSSIQASKKSITFSKPVLKRVILGGLDVLHRAICTYVALQAVDPALCQKIDFQFYVVPLGRNDLAAFIAQRDGWYRKHVFVPFHGPLMLVPQMKADGSSGASAEVESGPVDRDGRNALTSGGTNSHSTTNPISNIAASRRTSATNMMLGLSSTATKMLNSFAAFDSEHTTDGNGEEDLHSLDYLDESTGLATDAPLRRSKLDVAPCKLLRPLMESYIRSAKNVFPVTIFDCECWESPDAIETDRNPDVTIPFCARVELGLGAAIASHTSSLEFTTNFDGHSVREGLGADPTLDEILNDKTFLKLISGNNPELKPTTPELTVHMYTMSVDGTLDDRYILELADSHYLGLVISSLPRLTFPADTCTNMVMAEASDPPATAANPLYPWLEVQSVPARPGLVDLIRKKDKKPKDIDTIQEGLRYESKTHHIGFLDIRTTLTSRVPFFIAVDGQPFGPYYRVRIRQSTALSTSGGQAVMANTPKISFPVMTFLPSEKGEM